VGAIEKENLRGGTQGNQKKKEGERPTTMAESTGRAARSGPRFGTMTTPSIHERREKPNVSGDCFVR